jgi:hypothetical protein
MLFWGAYEHIAISQPAQSNSKQADGTLKPTTLDAKLVFIRAEPIQQSLLIRDQRLELMNLNLWFRNEGQAAARLLTLGTMPLLTDKILTPAEEENYFNVAATQWSVKLDGEVEPGQTVSFASQNGIDDEGWSEFQAKRKYLYSFLAVTYRSKDSDAQNEIITETCVWFQNGDTNTVNDCQSNHNQAVLRRR